MFIVLEIEFIWKIMEVDVMRGTESGRKDKEKWTGSTGIGRNEQERKEQTRKCGLKKRLTEKNGR